MNTINNFSTPALDVSLSFNHHIAPSKYDYDELRKWIDDLERATTAFLSGRLKK